jgi:Flp pilus assembly pilin Flp
MHIYSTLLPDSAILPLVRVVIVAVYSQIGEALSDLFAAE